MRTGMQEISVLAEVGRSLRDPIVERVRSLQSQEHPLNISAVKRRFPDLMKSVYELRPFIGWAGVLREAGIDYRSVKVELMETCECGLCKHKAPILTTHLRSAHGMSPKEYLKQCPNGQIMCESIRAERMKACASLAHWEPVWSPEYVLDRIDAFRRHDVGIHFYGMTRVDRPLTAMALSYFGSWDHAITKLGLSVEAVRRTPPGRSLSEKEIAKRLRERRDKGLPLNDTSVAKDDLQLYNAMRRRFGSHRRALRAAGIDPHEVQRKVARYSVQEQRLLIAEVRRVSKLKGPERHRAVMQLHKDFERIALACFGSWRKVAESAGVPSKRLLEYRFPDRESVLEWLIERVRKGKSIQPMAVFQEDRSLYDAVLRYFKNFRKLNEELFKKPSEAEALLPW